MSYEKIYEKLSKLPKAKRRFTRHRYNVNGCVCVIGALIPGLKNAKGLTISTTIVKSLTTPARRKRVLAALKVYDVDIHELRDLQRVNDNTEGTPSERYTYLMQWLKERVT